MPEAAAEGAERTQYVAFPIADGNGVKRDPRNPGRTSESQFENRVEAPMCNLMIGRQSGLVVPRPLNRSDRPKICVQERIVVSEPCMRAADSILIVRKAATWEPFKDDVVFDDKRPTTLADFEEVLQICVGADAADEELQRLIAAMHGVNDGSTTTAPTTTEAVEALGP